MALVVQTLGLSFTSVVSKAPELVALMYAKPDRSLRIVPLHSNQYAKSAIATTFGCGRRLMRLSPTLLAYLGRQFLAGIAAALAILLALVLIVDIVELLRTCRRSRKCRIGSNLPDGDTPPPLHGAKSPAVRHPIRWHVHLPPFIPVTRADRGSLSRCLRMAVPYASAGPGVRSWLAGGLVV